MALPTSASEVIQVVEGRLEPEKSPIYQKFEKLLGWADEVRRLGIRANADVPKDAKVAFGFGARGIGLCRTEHMFFGAERLPHVVKMILAAARGQRGIDLTRRLKERLKEAKGGQAAEIKKELAKVEKEYGKYIKDYTTALKKLEPMQKADFMGLFKEMHGSPVTIRTLDPPLHEFLPKREELMVEIATLKAQRGSKGKSTIAAKEKLLRAVEELHEFNPMLGHRGCRLGITYPEITKMQARAIFEAALAVVEEGHSGQARGDDPARRPRRGAEAAEGDRARGRPRGARPGRLGRRLPDRHHDRGAARRHDGRRDREGGAVLLLRHQRPDADGLRPVAATTPRSSCSTTRSTASSSGTRSSRSTRPASGCW